MNDPTSTSCCLACLLSSSFLLPDRFGLSFLRGMLSTGRSSMYPFTPTQWQELEHQALIYKYMASGIPIPSDLLLPFRSSFFLNATATAPPNFPQPTMGWSCYHQMGYGRKAEDPEPGRCRRTDGKKWRCSKEAYPDSKYCERHMHRGKNRSRKPVEISLNNNNTTHAAAATTTTTNSNTTNTSSSTPFSLPPLSTPASHDTSYYPYQLHYPHNQRDYHKLCYGIMKDADEYAFLSEASAGSRGSSWELTPLGLGEPKQGSFPDEEEEEEEEKKNEHCFVLGADFKQGSAKESEHDHQRPLRRFFDEWPQKSGREHSWMGPEADSSKTQLSISIPMELHDFPL